MTKTLRYGTHMTCILTTDHPDSHYGIPALVVDGQSIGPADSLDKTGLFALRGADIVMATCGGSWGPDSDHDLIRLGAAYLRQWPDGPQITHLPTVEA